MKIEEARIGVITGLILIALTYILHLGELAISFYIAGLFFVFFGAANLLLSHWYLSKEEYFLEDIL